MIKKEELKNRLLTPYEYDIIYEGEYLTDEIMYSTFDSKKEFKEAFYKYNKGKTAIDTVFNLVWGSDFLHFQEDVTGNYIWVSPPVH